MQRINRYGYLWSTHTGLEPRHHLPKTSGIYLIRVKNVETNRSKVAYVGNTQCFNRRVKSHDVFNLLLKKCSEKYSIHFLFNEINSGDYFHCFKIRRSREKELIKQIQPCWNVSGHNKRHSKGYYTFIHYERLKLFK